MTTAIPRVRAHYHLITPRIHPNVVSIVDMDNGAMSVTNDAEAVVAQLKAMGALRPGDRLVYRDTQCQYDELALDDQMEFAGFRSLGASTLQEAVQKLFSSAT